MKKKLFVISFLVLIVVGLFAQDPYGVYVRFINTDTSIDWTDISSISFEVELDPPSGDIQVGPNDLCFVQIEDVGAGVPHSFVVFNLANFAIPYTPTSHVRVTIWDGANRAVAGEVIYEIADLEPARGFMGWSEWFNVGGYPLNVEPDINQTKEEKKFPEEKTEENK